MSILIFFAALMGGGLWYTQNYAYYEVEEVDNYQMVMTLVGTDMTQNIPASGFTILDAETSPLKFRACFEVVNSIPMMTETYVVYDSATPLQPPSWFSCFDHEQLTEDLETGEAIAFLGQKNISHGVDRVVAVYGDGRAFAWHQLNELMAD